MFIRKIAASASVLALSGGLLLGTVAPASAANDLDVANPAGLCNTSTLHHRVSTKTVNSKNLGGRLHLNNKNGKNTTTSDVSLTVGGTQSSTLTGTISGGLNTAIFTAQAGASKAIQKSVSWTAGMSVKLTAPKGTIKYAQLTTNMYTMQLESFRYNSNCVKKSVSSSKLIAPSSTGWKTW